MNQDSIIGEDIIFRGKIHFKNVFKLNGKFRGQIQSSGDLIIGHQAQVEADIEVMNITVEGSLKGNVIAGKEIRLMKNARLYGDIRTPHLITESGAKFNGSCIMD
ncbi:MAG: polymer-forming cytoskeletal protein [Spirochaetia bacterium]|nr:polymer-forming cytoskeletal protein [Spirochaetia bacterium]